LLGHIHEKICPKPNHDAWILFQRYLESRIAHAVVISISRSLDQLEHQLGGNNVCPMVTIELELDHGTTVADESCSNQSSSFIGIRALVRKCVCGALNFTHLSDAVTYPTVFTSLSKINSHVTEAEQHFCSLQRKFSELKECLKSVPESKSTLSDTICRPFIEWNEEINLSQMGDKIRQLLSYQSELDSISNDHTVAFIQIDCRNIKQKMNMQIAKLAHLCTSHIEKRVALGGEQLDAFLTKIPETLTDMAVRSDSFRSHMLDVNEKVKCILKSLRNMVNFLETFDVDVDTMYIRGEDIQEFLEHAEHLWDNILTDAFRN